MYVCVCNLCMWYFRSKHGLSNKLYYSPFEVMRFNPRLLNVFVCIVCSYIIPQEKKRGLSIRPWYVIIAYHVEFMISFSMILNFWCVCMNVTLNFNDTKHILYYNIEFIVFISKIFNFMCLPVCDYFKKCTG